MIVDHHADFYGLPNPAPGPRLGTDLTSRELQVLEGISEGRSYIEIGKQLFISQDTAKTHARRMFRKLGARDRAHAVAQAFRFGVLR